MSLPSHDAVLGYIGQIIPLTQGALCEYENWILFKVGKPVPPLTTHHLTIGVEWFVEDHRLNISVHRVDETGRDLLINDYLFFRQIHNEFIPLLKQLLHMADSQLIVEDITKQLARRL